ncbi:MAG: hypothetical protein AAGC74_10915 [Verrucomicrobiota bacterium]
MKSDEHLAKSLLKIREDGFPPPWSSITGKSRVHLLRYLVVATYTWFLIKFWNDLELRAIMLFGFGFLLGAFITEIKFLWRIGSAWKFTEKITDWPLVAQIANHREESPSEPGD